MKKNNLILTIGIFLIITASIVFLYMAGNLQNQIGYDKKWTAIYFSDLESFNFDNPQIKFIIENHEGKIIKYNYQVLWNSSVLLENKIDLEPTITKEIVLPLNLSDKSSDGSNKLSVILTYDNQKKEIYKYIKDHER